MLNKRFFIIFYIIFSFNFIYPANQQFEIKFGFGGYSVPGYWSPLYIKINQDIKSGKVEIERKNNANVFLKEVFPLSKNNTVECPILYDENINSVVVRLFSENELLIERTINIDEKIFPGHIILTNGLNSRIQQSIAHSLFPDEPIQVVPISLENLPSVGLNYDSITAVVITDPGILLTPSQINALKYWIAGGGQVVVFNLLSETDSIISKLSGKILSDDKYLIFGSGYGKIIGFYEDVMSSGIAYDSSEWQKLLGLKPFGQNPRLTAAKILRQEDNILRIKFNYSSLRIMIFICVLSWALIFFILLFFTKRNILILSIFTLITLIVFIPFGNYFKKKWQGGAAYLNRIVVLPGNNGFLINSRLWFPNIYSNDFNLMGIKIDFGISEKAFLSPRAKNSGFLVHKINIPDYVLKKGTNEFIDIVSYQPFDKINKEFLKNIPAGNRFDGIPDIKNIYFQEQKNLVLVKGKNRDLEWWYWDINNHKWKREKENPVWLNNDLEWIMNIKKNRSDVDLLIGFDNIDGINIKLQGELCPRTLWVMIVKT